MLIILVSQTNCFEFLFTCPGKRFPLTEKMFYSILHANTFKKTQNKYSIFKNTKRVIK